MLIYTDVLEKYAFNEYKCNYSQEYKYLFMLLLCFLYKALFLLIITLKLIFPITLNYL